MKYLQPILVIMSIVFDIHICPLLSFILTIMMMMLIHLGSISDSIKLLLFNKIKMGILIN
ncbi:hypothetical protein DERP_010267 [Dermatophagoides pteronyssinus]|uniref:Uncharacterized protein n=1 Tax=Dermatophagoides pteronyssinus TaxID=6956 RepID=A0ABQ8J778_DERPT|nr:hypothetical protein DERP_010267 [Dermatophagoides pteronyssinus]